MIVILFFLHLFDSAYIKTKSKTSDSEIKTQVLTDGCNKNEFLFGLSLIKRLDLINNYISEFDKYFVSAELHKDYPEVLLNVNCVENRFGRSLTFEYINKKDKKEIFQFAIDNLDLDNNSKKILTACKLILINHIENYPMSFLYFEYFRELEITDFKIKTDRLEAIDVLPSMKKIFYLTEIIKKNLQPLIITQRKDNNKTEFNIQKLEIANIEQFCNNLNKVQKVLSKIDKENMCYETIFEHLNDVQEISSEDVYKIKYEEIFTDLNIECSIRFLSKLSFYETLVWIYLRDNCIMKKINESQTKYVLKEIENKLSNNKQNFNSVGLEKISKKCIFFNFDGMNIA